MISVPDAAKVAIEVVRIDVNKIRQGCMAVRDGVKADATSNSKVFQKKMEVFSKHADRACEEAAASLEQAESEFASLCLYFASPPPPATTPDSFFKLVADFLGVFKRTVNSVTARRERQEKQAQREAARTALKLKATVKGNTSGKAYRVPHKRALTGIDMTSIANAAVETMQQGDLNKTKEDSAPAAPVNAADSKSGFNEVKSSTVMKAVRRASVAMDVAD